MKEELQKQKTMKITVHHMDEVYPAKTKHFQTAVFNFYRYRGRVKGKVVLVHAIKTWKR